MLECIDSYEISEWMAYEKAFGPIGPDYRDRALAAIHTQIRQLCIMYGQVHTDGDFDADDIPIIPMPDEIYKSDFPEEE